MGLGIWAGALACLEAQGFVHKWPDSLNIKKWHESFILVTFQIGDYSFKPWHYGLIFSIQLCLLHLHYKYNILASQMDTRGLSRNPEKIAKNHRIIKFEFQFPACFSPKQAS